MLRTIRLCCLLVVSGVWMFAQEYRGIITGIVVDASGAAIPSAKVQVTHVATSTTFDTFASTNGAYTFSLLEPGTYQLRAEAKGFKPLVVSDLEVHTAEKIGLNLRLEVGEITQTVQVTATRIQTGSRNRWATPSAH